LQQLEMSKIPRGTLGSEFDVGQGGRSTAATYVPTTPIRPGRKSGIHWEEAISTEPRSNYHNLRGTHATLYVQAW